MKINVLFFLIFSISLSSIAQTPEKIKNNSDYIWGESTASTLEQADQFALKDLISQISTNVESSFSNIITEINESIEEYTQSAINTYSNIYLKNAKRIVVEKRKQIYVLRYIEKDEVDKMFDSRKNKIIDYTKLADMAEKDSRIGDALRYYYWALVLLNSHPDAAMIKYTTAENIEIGILLYIQNQFDKIFDNLRINVADTINCNNTVSYTLDINYKGQAVANLDYVYWNGTEFSNT
ncbi:MAG: LPP20 family lipoprotein, partial [Bacteroidales bacterium]|nr:LPP20 family lipoprotein [Bacteroidales bacterium]